MEKKSGKKMISKKTISIGIFILLILSIALNFLSIIVENTVHCEVLMITKLVLILLLMILIVVFQPRWIYWWRSDNKKIEK